jgi:poly(3-hydroxybutyrate) depolymerase
MLELRSMKRPCLRPLHFLAALIAAAAVTPVWAHAATLVPGAGRFEFQQHGKLVPVWYYLPEAARADSPILIVMHGVNRDADRYRDEWIGHAKTHGFILIAPEFSRKSFPGEEGYNLGGMVDAQGRTQPSAQWTFSFIEPIFDAVKAATENRSARYFLYGHSAGAQFVHRFMCFMPDARVAKAVAANAGWWTLPDPTVDFPYGLRGSTLDSRALKLVLQRPLVVLLGTADTDPNHVHLRRTPEALAQGPHRFARGNFFYASAARSAKALGVPLGWQLAAAPGVGHSDRGMAVFAVRYLFGPPEITGRNPDRARVLFCGDTSGGESYQEEYAKQGGTNILLEKGYDYGIASLRRLLDAVDYRVVNLETPLTMRRDSKLKTKDYLHYSDPVKLPALFTRFGPSAFSLANNHTLDHGPEGLDDTIAALSAAGADWFGSGRTSAEAARPLRQDFRVNGRRVTLAVFGAFEYRKDYDEEFGFYARADRPGTAAVDVAAVRQAIAELRRGNAPIFVVYFVHWGQNYVWKNAEQTTTARALREAGVDLIVGHGAHTMQEIEHDGQSWIFYSIGNFLFNTRGRYAAHKAPPFGLPLLVQFSLEDDRLQTGLRVYPIVSDNQLTDYQSRFVTKSELVAIQELLADKSSWDGPTRAAVESGEDEIGPWLEFTTRHGETK